MKVKSQVSCPIDILTYISQCLKYILLAAAIYFITVYVVLAISHIRFPFAIEWIEGSMLTHVSRVLAGKPLYVRPSIEFVTAMYTPLYFYLAALMAKIVGFGFAPLRIVSFLASLGSFFLIFSIVVKETKSRFAGAIASCLFIATYRIGGPYLDLARVDSTFLFFLLTTLYFVKFPSSGLSFVLAGAFMAFTTLTKQTGLALFLPIMLYCILFCPRRHAGIFALISVGIMAGASLYINYVHDGWYNYYIFILPRQQLVPEIFFRFWTDEIILALPFSCILAIVYFVSCYCRQSKREFVFYLLVVSAMIGIACIGRIKLGGFKNVLMPAYAALALMTGLAVHEIRILVQRMPRMKQKMTQTGLYVLCLGQFLMLIYNPFRWIPGEKYRMMCQDLIQAVAKIDGEVFAPAYGYLCVLAGKKNSAHMGYIDDFRKGSPDPIKTRFLGEIRDALQKKRFRAIILDRKFDWFHADIETHYIRLAGFHPGSSFWPLVKYFYVPKDSKNNGSSKKK